MAEKKETENAGFPLEKILTVSARDYVESQGKNLGDYELRGVCLSICKWAEESPFNEFTKLFQQDAEAVVNYQHSIAGAVLTKNEQRSDGTFVGFDELKVYHQMSGTALIPKQKEKEEAQK